MSSNPRTRPEIILVINNMLLKKHDSPLFLHSRSEQSSHSAALWTQNRLSRKSLSKVKQLLFKSENEQPGNRLCKLNNQEDQHLDQETVNLVQKTRVNSNTVESYRMEEESRRIAESPGRHSLGCLWRRHFWFRDCFFGCLFGQKMVRGGGNPEFSSLPPRAALCLFTPLLVRMRESASWFDHPLYSVSIDDRELHKAGLVETWGQERYE